MRMWPWVLVCMGCGADRDFNDAPWVEIEWPRLAAEVTPGEELRVVAVVGDMDHPTNELHYRVLLDDVEQCSGTPLADGAVDCRLTTPTDRTSSLVAVLVVDPEGVVGGASTGFFYEDLGIPWVRADVPDTLSAGDVHLAATVGDLDTNLEDLRVAWFSNVHGLLVEGIVPIREEVYATVTLDEGVHQLTVKVLDDQGKSATDARFVEVVAE